MRPALSRSLKPLVLLGGLLAAGWTLRTLSSESLAAPRSPLLFLPLGALLCAVGVPRQAVAFAAGLAFGMEEGVAVALAAQMLGCTLDLLWARLVARAWARRRLAGRSARLDAMLSAHPFTTTLLLRLLPVGNNLLLNLLAGVSSVAAGPFLAASLIGYLPQTLVFTLAGAGTRLGRAGELGVGVALFAASAGLGLLLLARLRRASPATAAALSADGADAPYAATRSA